MKDNAKPGSKIKQFVALDHTWIDKWLTKLPGTTIKIYLALRYHSSRKGKIAWPSYTRLQKMTGCGRGQVAKALKELSAANLIEIDRSKRCNEYRFQIETSSKMELVSNQNQFQSETDIGSRSELQSVPDRNSNQSKEPEQKNQSNIPPKKPRKPKDPKPTLTNEQRIAKLESLDGYHRNAGGVIGIWMDIYHVSSPIPPADPTKAEAGNLNLIWKRALSSSDDDPEKAIRFALMAFQEAWRRHRSQRKFPFEDPPTPDGVYRHWPAMISAGVKANPPPCPELPTHEERAKMSDDERSARKQQRDDWFARYGDSK